MTENTKNFVLILIEMNLHYLPLTYVRTDKFDDFKAFLVRSGLHDYFLNRIWSYTSAFDLEQTCCKMFSGHF